MKFPRLTLSSQPDRSLQEAETTVEQERAQQREEDQAAVATQVSFAEPPLPSRMRPMVARRPTQGLAAPRQTRGAQPPDAKLVYEGALALSEKIRTVIEQGSARQRQGRVDELIERLERAVGLLDNNKAAIGTALDVDAWMRVKNLVWAVQHHRARMARKLDVDTSHQLLRQDLGAALMRRAARPGIEA